MRSTVIVATAVVCVALAACDGSSDGSRSAIATAAASTAATAQPAEGRFSAEDLPRILLHADEAPPGTRSEPSLAHASDLDAFAHDVVEQQALLRDGFRSGYVVYFPPESYFRHEPHAVTDVAFEAIGGLFDDADGASSSLRRFVEDLRTRQMNGAAQISAGGLGDESFGLAGGASLDGSFVRVYAWRVSNVILVLVASGPVAEDKAMALARAMDRRAA